MSAPFVLALRVLLAVSLYAFLGWTLFTIWRELHAQGSLLAARKTPGIGLNIQIDDQTPTQRYVTQPEILLGRDSHCDIPLLDDTVSVRHARLAYHHGQWWLEDLGSTNGTWLNKEKVSTPTVIIGGDQIDCGKVSISINLGVDPTNPPTQRIPTSGDSE
ncbi:MAG: FHA domain-containing protein [Anaerolineales bacterium]|jgi:pSer/pThr/pTyr-binding forkhead associated (FHA) protein